ncbi:sulfite reductase hemo protein, beta-component [Pseudovirgaria hyperparasitica]|uniref:Sulfite reductase [NADPH] subunit beta n=1 Tax=Pseudovirgaria hyperparasitica TaxID=470096 RepID=A0A6A6VWS1_9PEZI|nr:sulfite reductase hemo protein, beta-component [Pseudovirgaria hyperparasitica]KAF2754615.1 sulfite reductase hemo protein, beta-component [Pseudovirgaria hyperparasitica]
MGSISSAGEAAARVAYLSSDVVISVQPSLSTESEFSSYLQSYSEKNLASLTAKAAPEIFPVRQNADPLLSAFQPIRSGKVVSVTTDSSILLKSIPHLYKLAQYPIVLHVALESLKYPDYSSITAIRQSGFTFIQSEKLQEVWDLGLSAHALAIRSGKGVIHFFDPVALEDDLEIAADKVETVRQILDLESTKSWQSTRSEETSLYVNDGRAATIDVARSQGEHSLAESGQSADQTVLSGATEGIQQSERSSSVSSSSKRDSSDGNGDASSLATSFESITSRPVTSEDVYNYAKQIWGTIKDLTGRAYDAFEYSGSNDATAAVFVFGSDAGLFGNEIDQAKPTDEYANAGLITVRLYRPWLGSKLADILPKSVKKIAVLEQIRRKTTKWGPLLLDLLMTLKTAGSDIAIVGYQVGYIEEATARQAIRGVFQNLALPSPIQNLEIGNMDGPEALTEEVSIEQPELENAYMKVLKQIFSERLHVANQLGRENAGISASVRANPEFGFGKLMARKERRSRFVEEVQAASKSRAFLTENPATWLSKWALAAENPEKANQIAPEVISRLSTDGSAAATQLLSTKSFFFNESQWLVGSDAWAYDLGNSGVHHVLASGANVNMLIVDSQPYSERAAADAARRKKDIGLYAMNFGNAYVASVAVYSSYTQVLQAMIEADKFNGPAVVLAYLPYNIETDSPLTVLQETKKAVDLGYWPLYRWDPSAEKGDDRFKLDSERIKQELQQFLKRDNYLSQLMNRHPQFAANISSSYGTEVRQSQKRKAKDAYSQLLEGLLGAPLTVLFASDNGNAENLAKRLGNRGKARGLKTMVMAMDDYPLEDLSSEENVVLITSTAGQGEFPQNGHAFWEGVKDSTDLDLATVNFAVFALGDSHYWPRKEDKIYYNKPGKDLHARFLTLGGHAMTECGLGDDQDPDSYQTGYAEWEPKLWQALGVDNVEGLPEEPPPITNEDIKIESNFLRGTIMEGLRDTSTGAISAPDQQLTKFHGTYMQDDRDIRDERKAQGLEPAYSFMIRCRLPGGVATPDQWVKMDAIASSLGNETMKLTTRQTFQFHGVVKGKLRPAMQAINKALMTTIAACGDVNRNVMCSSLPQHSQYHAEVHAVSKKISDHLLPSTTAYHEIWLKDENDVKTQVAGDAVVDSEPLYGPTYLPRKFKITIAIPPHNDTDVYAHDIGLIAIKGANGHLEGFNIIAGGGMGATHNNKKTYPQTGRMFGYVPAHNAHIACEKIMLVQRDHGDRKNRKHARLKYTIDDMGVDVFKGKVEELWGHKFLEPRPFEFKSNIDTFGWQKDENGKNHFTFFIENGRIEDTTDFQMKTGLLEIAKAHKGEFRLTGNQHLILSNVDDADLPALKKLMKQYKLDNTSFSGMRLSSSACVAFPTCGLAMAESERYLPELITKLESTLESNGLGKESIVMRMTGCPNGCARPWLAEIAFVGKAFGAYNMYLGGGYHGQRLNKLYRSSIKEEEILDILKPMLKRYSLEKEEGEHFGDWCIRSGIINETTDGMNFHDNTAEVESDEE